MIETKNRVQDILNHGQGNAITAARLAEYFKTDIRSIQRAVSNERMNGAVIAGSGKGYFIPDTPEELERYIARAEKQARSCFVPLRSAKDQLKKMQLEKEGQLTFSK